MTWPWVILILGLSAILCVGLPLSMAVYERAKADSERIRSAYERDKHAR